MTTVALICLLVSVLLTSYRVVRGPSWGDRKLLYAHAINIEDVSQARESVTQMETRILGFMR